MIDHKRTTCKGTETVPLSVRWDRYRNLEEERELGPKLEAVVRADSDLLQLPERHFVSLPTDF